MGEIPKPILIAVITGVWICYTFFFTLFEVKSMNTKGQSSSADALHLQRASLSLHQRQKVIGLATPDALMVVPASRGYDLEISAEEPAVKVKVGAPVDRVFEVVGEPLCLSARL